MDEKTWDEHIKIIISQRLLHSNGHYFSFSYLCISRLYSAAQIYPNYAYAYYTRISICAHTRVYAHVYVSLLYLPISFFIWSIVG